LLTTVDADTGNIATSTANIDSKTPALGQALAAASVPVVLTAAQVSTLTPQTDALTDTQLRASAVPVSAASLPLPTGAATSAKQDTGNTSLASIDGKLGSLGQKTMAGSAPVTIASDQSALPVSQSGTWTVQPGNTANTTAWLVTEQKSATATLANVASSASSVTLQASNSSRKGLNIFNDSTAILYVKFGATASTSSYTVQIAAGGYYELPASPALYTGIVDGIWASANGNARVTELS
jgi:hypothetical protein